MSEFFFIHTEKNSKNNLFIDHLKQWAESNKEQVYVVDSPLVDGNKYTYSFKEAFVLLIPKHRITFVNFSVEYQKFKDFIEDFIEDLGHISNKYQYKDKIGRPKQWKDSLVCQLNDIQGITIDEIIESIKVTDKHKQRAIELLISLIIGSINNIEKNRSKYT